MNIAVIFSQPIENDTSSMIRCRNIINELPKLGARVICFTPYPNMRSIYYDKKINLNMDIEFIRYGKKVEDKSDKLEIRKEKPFLYKLIKKIDLFGLSILNVRYKKEISRIIIQKKCDTLLSFSDPKSTHIIAGYCKKKNPKLFYIQQWGDPLAEDISNQTIIPYCIKKKIEKSILNKADKICYVSPITCDRQKKIFFKMKEKMIFLPTPCEKIQYKSPNNPVLTVGYFGSYNLVARDIRPLYFALSNFKKSKLLIVGDSDLKLDRNESVELVGRVAQSELEEYMKDMDVLICLMNSRGTQIPGKLYNYAGTNKEILVIVDGENGTKIKEYFENFNRYTFVENSVDAIKAAINTYLEKGIPIRCPLTDFEPLMIAKKLITK